MFAVSPLKCILLSLGALATLSSAIPIADTSARDLTSVASVPLDVVTSVDLFNEGVDVPDVDLIAFMRVTHSRRIFVQQLGRGLRVSPAKDRVLVLDFVSGGPGLQFACEDRSGQMGVLKVLSEAHAKHALMF